MVTTTDVALPRRGDRPGPARRALWGLPAADATVARGLSEARPPAGEVGRRRAAEAPAAQAPAAAAAARLHDPDYADQPYSSRERRFLAGIRLWAVLDNFFPYRYLIADWDAALRMRRRVLAAAPDRDAYVRALRRLGVRPAMVTSKCARPCSISTVKQRGPQPVATRPAEGTAVTRLDAAAAGKLGLAVGDVVETIDGKPVARLVADARVDTSASTDEARDQRIAALLLAGDDGTTASFEVRGADGKLRAIAASRVAANAAAPAGPHWKQSPATSATPI